MGNTSCCFAGASQGKPLADIQGGPHSHPTVRTCQRGETNGQAPAGSAKLLRALQTALSAHTRDDLEGQTTSLTCTIQGLLGPSTVVRLYTLCGRDDDGDDCHLVQLAASAGSDTYCTADADGCLAPPWLDDSSLLPGWSFPLRGSGALSACSGIGQAPQVSAAAPLRRANTVPGPRAQSFTSDARGSAAGGSCLLLEVLERAITSKMPATFHREDHTERSTADASASAAARPSLLAVPLAAGLPLEGGGANAPAATGVGAAMQILAAPLACAAVPLMCGDRVMGVLWLAAAGRPRNPEPPSPSHSIRRLQTGSFSSITTITNCKKQTFQPQQYLQQQRHQQQQLERCLVLLGDVNALEQLGMSASAALLAVTGGVDYLTWLAGALRGLAACASLQALVTGVCAAVATHVSLHFHAEVAVHPAIAPDPDQHVAFMLFPEASNKVPPSLGNAAPVVLDAPAAAGGGAAGAATRGGVRLESGGAGGGGCGESSQHANRNTSLLRRRVVHRQQQTAHPGAQQPALLKHLPHSISNDRAQRLLASFVEVQDNAAADPSVGSNTPQEKDNLLTGAVNSGSWGGWGACGSAEPTHMPPPVACMSARAFLLSHTLLQRLLLVRRAAVAAAAGGAAAEPLPLVPPGIMVADIARHVADSRQPSRDACMVIGNSKGGLAAAGAAAAPAAGVTRSWQPPSLSLGCGGGAPASSVVASVATALTTGGATASGGGHALQEQEQQKQRRQQQQQRQQLLRLSANHRSSSDAPGSLLLLAMEVAEGGCLLALYVSFPTIMPPQLLAAAKDSCERLLRTMLVDTLRQKMKASEIVRELDTLRAGVPGVYVSILSTAPADLSLGRHGADDEQPGEQQHPRPLPPPLEPSSGGGSDVFCTAAALLLAQRESRSSSSRGGGGSAAWKRFIPAAGGQTQQQQQQLLHRSPSAVSPEKRSVSFTSRLRNTGGGGFGGSGGGRKAPGRRSMEAKFRAFMGDRPAFAGVETASKRCASGPAKGGEMPTLRLQPQGSRYCDNTHDKDDPRSGSGPCGPKQPITTASTMVVSRAASATAAAAPVVGSATFASLLNDDTAPGAGNGGGPIGTRFAGMSMVQGARGSTCGSSFMLPAAASSCLPKYPPCGLTAAVGGCAAAGGAGGGVFPAREDGSTQGPVMTATMMTVQGVDASWGMRGMMGTLVDSLTTTIRALTDPPAPFFEEGLDRRGGCRMAEELEDLQLQAEALGYGASGVVMRGTLGTMPVAVKLVEMPVADDCDEMQEKAVLVGLPRKLLPPRTAQQQTDSAEVKARRNMLRNATELAFARVISHFCIVQVFAVYDNVVMERTSGSDSIALRRLDTSNPETGGSPVCTAIVQELCDCGSLAGVLADRSFPTRVYRRASVPSPAGAAAGLSRSITTDDPSGGAGTVCLLDLKGVYMTLLEIALALRHLHSRRLVHRDVKPANILLKSCAADFRGWTCKLADFGLAAMLDKLDNDPPPLQEEPDEDGQDVPDGRFGQTYGSTGGRRWYTIQSQASGTVTHMAPEAMIPNGRIDSSVDIFSLGIIFWELVCGRGRRPYPHLDVSGIPKAVTAGERPVFSVRVPDAYRRMDEACWAHEPHRRPRAADVVAFLKQQMVQQRQR